MLHLICILSLRELKQRYHQRYLKTAWAVINPLFQLCLFTLVFSKIVRFDSEGAPYVLFVFSALLPWVFFSSCLSSSCYSLTSNRNLITRLYFPRIAIPLSVLLTHLIDFAIAAALLLVFLTLNGFPLDAPFLALLPIFLLQLLFTAGIVLFVSIGNAYLRDVGSALPMLTQAWLFASPIVYSAHAVPERFRSVYFLNPMAVIIDSYRRVLLHGQTPDTPSFTTALVISLVILATGYLLFKTLEPDLADVV